MFMIMWLSVECVHDPSVHTKSLKLLCHDMYIYMWRSMTKPTILGTTSFWVKATITNYNLWTTDHANLKSLAPIGSEIWARMYLDHPYYNFTVRIMIRNTATVHCTWKSAQSPFLPSKWTCQLSQWAGMAAKMLQWEQQRRFWWKKDDRTSVSKDRT